ncbi:GAF domain-containing protein [Yoonia sp.]|uniref:GAF domain-containing protein n=1 Tax=Yoonia sp. TaxID=2212373 RepID=UPI003976C56F
MTETPLYPVGPEEARRLRLLQTSGFADSVKTPELDLICEEARSSFGTKFACVTLLTEGLQILKGRAGIDIDSTPRDVAFCNYTILNDDVFIVLDATTDDRFRNNPLTAGEPWIRFYAGAPLIYVNDIRLGAFCLFDTSPRTDFTLGDQAELVEFAERTSHKLIKHLRSTG